MRFTGVHVGAFEPSVLGRSRWSALFGRRAPRLSPVKMPAKEHPHEDAEAFRVLFDGGCPLCRREAALLRWLDGDRGRLVLEDITAPGFNPARYGASMDQVMGEIYGVLPDGRLVTGMEVFRRAYAAVGLPWLLAPTRWPGVKGIADAAYAWFARNRLRLTGRGDCEDGTCRAAYAGDWSCRPGRG